MRFFCEETLPKWAAWLVPSIVLAAILGLRPHWGLMDDVTNIYVIVPAMKNVGILRHAWAYALGDIGWGMFRPTYPLMVYFVYVPGIATAAWVTFAWNALLVMGVVYFYARVLSRILGLSMPLLVLGCGAFFYGHDLFQHPSLQEKMILLAGAGLTWHCWNRRHWAGWSFWGVAALWILFGACVKASFVIHYCVAFLAFIAGNAEVIKRGDVRAWAEALVLGAIGVCLVGAFAYISKHGAYTSHYGSQKVIPNLLSGQGFFFLFPVALALLWCGCHWRDVWRRPEVLLPVVGVSAYVTIFAPWGLDGYVQSVSTPLYSALILQLCAWYLGTLPRAVWIVGISSLAIAVTTYRSFRNFARLHDVGAIVENAATLEQRGILEMWMPCNEGSLSMDRFFWEAGSAVRVKEISPNGPTSGKALLFDQALCPFAGRVPVPRDCANPETIQAGLFSKSYRVLRCH